MIVLKIPSIIIHKRSRLRHPVKIRKSLTFNNSSDLHDDQLTPPISPRADHTLLCTRGAHHSCGSTTAPA